MGVDQARYDRGAFRIDFARRRPYVGAYIVTNGDNFATLRRDRRNHRIPRVLRVDARARYRQIRHLRAH